MCGTQLRPQATLCFRYTSENGEAMRYCHPMLVISLSLLVSFAQEPEAKRAVSTPGYILGPDDQFVIHGVEIDEIAEKPVQVGQDGNVSLPMVGSIQAA